MTMESSAEDRIPFRNRITSSWDFFLDLPEEREAYFMVGQRRSLKKKEWLYTANSLATSVSYIMDGKIIMTSVNRDGKEVALFIRNNGWLAGALPMMTERYRDNSAQALTNCTVCEVSYRDFRVLAAKYPELQSRITLQFYLTLGFMIDQFLSALYDDAETRLIRFLASLYSQELMKLKDDTPSGTTLLYLTQEQLAMATGVTRSMITKILHRMKTRGIIEVSGHRIVFLKPSHFLDYLDPTSSRYR